jgi:hypothetical protein
MVSKKNIVVFDGKGTLLFQLIKEPVCYVSTASVV